MSDVVSKITIALNDKATSGMKGIGAEVDNLKGKVSSFGSALSNIGTGIGISAGMAGISGISDLLSEGFSTSLRVENIDATYNAIYDGAARAQKELSFIRGEADRLGLSFLDTADSAKMFFAASKGSSIEKDSKEIFSAFSELAVTMRLSKEQTNGMFIALGQSTSKGKLMAQELREQLGEKVPGIFRVIADSLGVTTTELDKMLEEGKVGLDALAKAVPVIRDRYGSALPEAINSTTAAIGRLNTKWDDLMAHSANTDALKAGINGLTEVIGVLDDGILALSEHSDMLSSAALGLGAGYAALTIKKKLLNQESLSTIKHSISEASVMKTLKGELTELAAAEMRAAQIQNVKAKAALAEAQRVEARLVREKSILENTHKIVEGETNKAAALGKMTIAEGKLAWAIKERSAAEATARASSAALTEAASRMNAAYAAAAGGGISQAARGMSLLKTAGAGLVSFLGGPWGIAFTAAAAGVTYLSTREDEGEVIGKRYASVSSDIESALKKQASAAQGARESTEQLSESQKKLSVSQAIEDQATALQQIQSLATGKGWLEALGLGGDTDEAVVKIKEKTVELLTAIRTGQGDISQLVFEIDKLGTSSDEAAKLAAKVIEELLKAERAGKVAGQGYELATGAAKDLAAATNEAKDAMSAPWVLNIDGAIKGIASMENSIRGMQAEMLGLKDAKLLVDLLPELSPEEIKAAKEAFGKNGLEGALQAVGEATKAWGVAQRLAFNDLLEKRIELESTDKRLDAHRKALRESSKDHTSAYNQMENNLASYTSELNQTEASIRSLQAQLATEPGEVFTREQAKIAKEYEATLAKINAEATKYANKKGITKVQAEELKQSKLQEASLQNKLDLRLAQEKQEKRLAELAKGKYDFYKEIEELSGQYGLSLQFQNEMIAAQAKELEHLKLPPEYIAQWKELKALQLSHDWADGAQRAFLQFRADAENAAKGTEEAFSSLYSGLDSGFKNVWQQILKDGKVSFSSFKSLFASFLADLTHMAFTRPITVQIAGAISGLFSSSGTGGVAGAAGGGGGGGMNNLSGLSSLIPNSWTSGISNTVNNAMADWFPSLFASTAATSNVAGIVSGGVNAVTNAAGAFGSSLSGASSAISNATGMVTKAAGSISSTTSSLGTFTSTLAPYLGAASLGSLGYSVLGGAMGLPQSKYSGITSALGSAAGWGLGSLAAGSSLAAGTGLAAGATFGSVIPIAGTIIGALAGGALGSLFGKGRKTHASVYGKMENLGFSRDSQSYIDAFMGGATYDRAGASEAKPFAETIGKAAATTAGTILDLAAALPDEYRKSVEDQLASATWTAGRGISGASWNLQWWKEGMAEERVQEAVNDMFEQMGYGANKAFAEAGIGDLFSSFDLSTEEGFTKATNAVNSINAISTAIDQIKTPTTEAEQQAKAFMEQVKALAESVKANGLNAEYADKLVGEYRTAYVDSYVKSLEEMFNPLSEIETQAKNYKNTIDGYVSALTTMGASEEQLATVRGYTQKAIDSITGSLDAAFFPLSDVEQQTKATMESLLAYKAALETLGASAEELTRIDAAWGKMQADLVSQFDAYITTTPEVVTSTRKTMESIVALRDALASTGAEALAAEKANAAWGKMQADLLDKARAYVSTTPEIISQAAAMNAEFNALRQAMVEAGSATADLIELERNRAQAVAAMQAEYVRSFDQSMSQRYAALNGTSDAVSRAISQENELRDTIKKFGEGSAQVAELLHVQAAENVYAAQASVDALQNQLNQLKAQAIQAEISALNEQMSAAKTLKDAWENLSKSLLDSRTKLWTSDADALGLFARRDAAQAEFDRLYSLTMSGDKEAAAELAASGDTLLALLKQTSANSSEYTDGFWNVEQKLKDAEAVAGKQLSEAQKSYNTLESQLKAQQSMLDALGVNNSSLEAINAQIVTVGQQLANALANLKIAQSSPNYGGTSSGGGTTSGGYVSWEDKLLQEKADAMNAGLTLNPDQTAGGWTPDKVLSAIKENGWTVADWYDKHGKAEGFATGGLTPLNKMFKVGEQGEEWMFSPSQYVVLNNSMTRKLDDLQMLSRQMRQPVIDYRLMQMPAVGTDGDIRADNVKLREEIREIRKGFKEMSAHIKAVSANTKELKNIMQDAQQEGLPVRAVTA